MSVCRVSIFFLIITVVIFSCDSSLNLVDSVDGPEGVALSISPVSGSIVISSTLTFSASGGVSPYTFSLSSNSSGSIDSETGVYIAPAAVGNETIVVNDSYGASANAVLEVISPPDYTVSLNPSISSSFIAGNAFNGTFTVENLSTTNGSDTIYWTAYMSTNTVLTSGTDPIASTGSLNALSGGSTSLSQSFDGIWPSFGTYYIIISLTVGDDPVIGNNIDVSSTYYTIDTPDVDYTPTFTIQPTGGVSGSVLSESVTLTNTGTYGGSNTVYWTAYMSSDDALDIGTDLVVDSGSETALISSGVATPAINSFWPDTAGDWYLIVNISADDDADPANNSVISAVCSVTVPQIDYRISSAPTGGATFTAGTAIPATETFTIINDGTEDGISDIGWIVYFSSDSSLEPDSDPILDFNTVSSLNSGDSIPVTFTRNWPIVSVSENFYMFISIFSSDDVNTSNNQATPASPYTITP